MVTHIHPFSSTNIGYFEFLVILDLPVLLLPLLPLLLPKAWRDFNYYQP